MNNFDFKFDVEGYGRDKKIGRLQKVVINPEMTHVTHLIFKQGVLFKQAVVLPLQVVQQANPAKVVLSLDAEEAADYPTFEEEAIEVGDPQPGAVQGRVGEPGLHFQSSVDYPAQREGVRYAEEQVVRQGVEPDDVIWDEETAIHGRDGRAGLLSHVIVNALDGRIHELVLSRGKLVDKSVAVPAALIEQADESIITVTAGNQEIEDMVEYFHYTPEVESVKGKSVKDENEEAHQEPLPSTAVIEPIGSSTLMSDLAAILATDRRTATAVVELICDRGIVTLAGTVDDQETKEAVVELVKQHPDVITVQNSLKVAH